MSVYCSFVVDDDCTDYFMNIWWNVKDLHYVNPVRGTKFFARKGDKPEKEGGGGGGGVEVHFSDIYCV